MNNQIEIQEPPHNEALEGEILGSILLNDKLMYEIVDTVPVKAFYNENHQHIYTAMLYLYHSNVGIGYETLIDRLQRKLPDDNDIVNYIFELRNVYISDDEFDNKIELLIDIYQKREMFNLYLRRVTTPLSGIASSNLVKEIEGVIENMGITSNIEYEKFEDYVDEWLEYQEDETPVEGFKTGFNNLDDTVLLLPTNLMLIGARPSSGKSALATNFVKNFCLQGKHPLFISLEMSRLEFMNRLVANISGVEARKLKRKEHKTSAEWANIVRAKETISQFKFNFYDKGNMYIEQLVGLARYLKKRGELDILIVDYLQLLQSHQFKNQRTQQVSYISHQLKMLAQELEIPVVALAQLSRAVIDANGKPREPQLSDLRESGDLENDANIILMLHTEDIEQKFVERRFIDLFIRKNRDGRLGKVKFAFYGDYLKFAEQEWNEERGKYIDAGEYDFGQIIK